MLLLKERISSSILSEMDKTLIGHRQSAERTTKKKQLVPQGKLISYSHFEVKAGDAS